MKRRTLSFVYILLFLLLSTPTYVATQLQVSPNIGSYGTTSYPTEVAPVSMNVHIRGVWLGDIASASEVDAFVSKYPYCNTIHLVDSADHVLNVIRYTEWDPSKTWHSSGSGITYDKLREVIDRFHYHGWKVVLESSCVAVKGFDVIWDYINDSHREFAFTDGYGKLAGVEGGLGKGGGRLIVDWFKNYTSSDPENNITAGVRLADVYCQRIKKMIQDGSFMWDGWYGTDGWNGLIIQGFFWLCPMTKYWGKGLGTDDPENWYSLSYQELNEWGNSSYVPANFPPEGWDTWSNIQRGDWIRGDLTARKGWFHYWQLRFAKFWAQINKVFTDTNRTIGTMISQDISSGWAGGNLGPIGMVNLTVTVQENSYNHYWIDSEWGVSEVFKANALVAGLAATKYPEIHCISLMKLSHWFVLLPTVHAKMDYLAQVLTYVWKNGTRHHVVDPTQIIFLGESRWWVNGTHASQTEELVQWAMSICNLINRNDLTPLYLGPTYVIPVEGHGLGANSYHPFNYTFIQFIDILNLYNQPENIRDEMNCLFIDQMIVFHGNMPGIVDTILNKFAAGNLSIYWYSSYIYLFKDAFKGEGEESCQSTFHLEGATGTNTTWKVLTSPEIMDSVARWIADGYYGNSYSLDRNGRYVATTGFIEIARFLDGKVGMGIYYNSTSARFVYVQTGTEYKLILPPPEMTVKALYWATDSPINSSEPLVNTYVFDLSDGTILIPMLNHKVGLSWEGGSCSDATRANPIPITLRINASRLGLGNPSNYILYWQSDWNGEYVMTVSDWNNVQITLKGGADILVIKPKGTRPFFTTSNGLLQTESWIESNKTLITVISGPTSKSGKANYYWPEMSPNVKVEFSNGTVLNAQDYWSSTTKLITLRFTFQNDETIRIYVLFSAVHIFIISYSCLLLLAIAVSIYVYHARKKIDKVNIKLRNT